MKTFCKLNVTVMIKSYLQQKNGLLNQHHFKGEILKGGFCQNHRNPSRSTTDMNVTKAYIKFSCSTNIFYPVYFNMVLWQNRILQKQLVFAQWSHIDWLYSETNNYVHIIVFSL